MQRFLAVPLAVLAVAALTAGCRPGTEFANRIDRLPEAVRSPVREAVWAHGNPYVWAEKRNVLIHARWADHRRGFETSVSRKVYTIDLRGRSMRIDDHGDGTTAMYNGVEWKYFVGGKRIRKPGTVTDKNVGALAMLEYAAGEMRCVRTLFALPFVLAEPFVDLESVGRVRSAAGAHEWDVVRAGFDYGPTGFLPDDRVMVYFDPARDVVDRVYVELSDHPFYAIPHWGEWSDYRRRDDGLLVPRRWDFRMTDVKGGADLGRRLSIVLEQVAFDVDLPAGVFNSSDVAPPPMPESALPAKPKVLGRDVVGGPGQGGEGQ